jgi:transcriptional regulator with XRE-family HTH domain
VKNSIVAFDMLLRRLRKTYVGKQLSLAASLGCTESAISFWEHGHRLPWRRAIPRIIACLREAGASKGEILELQGAYDERKKQRSAR